MSTEASRFDAAPEGARSETIVYDDRPVRWFVAASVGWGLVALLLGALIATQLAFAGANAGPWFSFGRLRPLHTNAAIFAFVGNMLFAGIYHSTQRLVRARTASETLSKIHFWGWQAIIVAAAVSLPLGFTQGKEYAELEWPIDLAITAVWVVFAVNFFWTLARRAEKHLYVAVWFYIATIVTVAVLHVVNSLAIPVLAMKSYSVFGGAQDALVQWWYGHNAVAFVLTTPILGIMYYYVPKAADRPVYSYRLSIIHFWALVFMYIWAGPHHLLNTALPEWAQTLGMIFSVMLWAPSWGGMLNGLLTLRGAWDKVRADPVLKFFVAALTFYGMATFEGPLLSIRSLSSLAHYTDWIVGHVHAGALGWNGFMAAGMFYFLVPRLYGTKLHSTRLAEAHFWIATVGIVLYVVAMWVSGITQGLMWQGIDEGGALLHPSFVETVVAIVPLYWMRLAGGTMYLAGFVMMAYNLWHTARGNAPAEASATIVRLPEPPPVPWRRLVFGAPAIVAALGLAMLTAFGLGNAVTAPAWLVAMVAVGGGAIFLLTLGKPKGETWHRLVEGRAALFTAFTVFAVLVGGVAEIVPALIVSPPVRPGDPAPKILTALELEGRDIYVREGCYNCHSQMIRPLAFETLRYGDASTMADSQYDHPFQWGSKRTGPDLAREGNKNPHAWHVQHFLDPRAITPGSNMPAYEHFATDRVDLAKTAGKMRALRSVGVPYTPRQVQRAEEHARAQGAAVAEELAQQGVEVAPDAEMVAIIAYLQSLGAPSPTAAAPPDEPVAASP
jgi:cytochrome c oxidase cbb3-type subunit I/II